MNWLLNFPRADKERIRYNKKIFQLSAKDDLQDGGKRNVRSQISREKNIRISWWFQGSICYGFQKILYFVRWLMDFLRRTTVRGKRNWKESEISLNEGVWNLSRLRIGFWDRAPISCSCEKYRECILGLELLYNWRLWTDDFLIHLNSCNDINPTILKGFATVSKILSTIREITDFSWELSSFECEGLFTGMIAQMARDQGSATIDYV